jgi:hypothetical protein
MRRYFFQTMMLLFAASVWTGCNKNDDDDNNQTEDRFKLSGAATGANERPDPVTTEATGTLSGTYNKEDNMLDYTITWNNLSAPAAAMHFHGPAGPEETAPPVVPITGFATETSGTYTGMATLTEEQEADLLAGKWYYNIHTSTHQGGEIRAQVVTTAD